MKARHKAEDLQTAAPEQPINEGQETVEKDLMDIVAEVRQARDERDRLQDQLLRTLADFQNFRKRQDEQRKQLEQFATERFVTALLPVIDNFERALASFEGGAKPETIIEGLKAVDRQFRGVLESQSVTRIPSVGEQFDPEVHEALATESTEEHEDNTIIGELEPGYKMSGKVIRPARVRVAKRP